jgi:DNA polymerase-3 subunit delta'
MNAAPGDDDGPIEYPHPRETPHMVGHAEAERTLLDSYRSGHIAHAWLIGGPPGIGKATLAYRMARFVLAHPDPAAPAVQAARSLAIDPHHPVARRIAAQAHTDLLVLERTLNDKGILRQDIAVDDVRRSVSFFGSTAGEGGWRVAIVDAVDELNASGANALLKVLEEPPVKALLLLVSHAPGQALATIRSRCRRLMLRPLPQDEVARAAAASLGRDPGDPALRGAAAAAEGSVARALALLDGPALALRERLLQQLARLPVVDARSLHGLAESLGDEGAFAAFLDTVNGWLTARLSTAPQDIGRLARVAKTWEAVNRTAQETEEFNLDRKPMVFAVFGLLAEAARG